ncbi:MAG: DUF2490 domain-containing protein [Kiritimatiellae bacterium]|nr:DUF2490 domain-containing protein [Kiritimatiellia bacterium]MDD5522709.1 DUF2490 domain-containing protein [Kiritimatiellia bacterium]
MRSVGKLMVGIAAVGIAVNVYAGGLNEEGDWQGWYIAGTSMKSGEWKLKADEEIRTGNYLHNVYYNHIDIGISRTVTKWLDLGANFRQVHEKKKGVWETEYRPHVNGTLKWKLGNWSFSDRNRLEFRDLQSSEDKWRYRNRLTIYPPVKLFGGNIKPYIADEIYEDLSGNNLDRNRVYAGAECKLADWLKSDVFYIWQSSYKDREWLDINVISVKFEVTF